MFGFDGIYDVAYTTRNPSGEWDFDAEKE